MTKPDLLCIATGSSGLACATLLKVATLLQFCLLILSVISVVLSIAWLSYKFYKALR